MQMTKADQKIIERHLKKAIKLSLKIILMENLEENSEKRQDVLEAAVKFMVDLLHLWNERVVEFGQPEIKISKEELYEELKKDIYEI